jgi:NitT/TauT family transport system substrate-binding protein
MRYAVSLHRYCNKALLFRLTIAALAASAILYSLCGGPVRASDLPTIRVGWVVPVANLPSILFEKPTVAHHLGQSYQYQPIRFASTVAMVTALATGDIDIGVLGYSAFAIAVTNAGMSDLRLIADEIRDGVEGYYTDEYMVRKDAAIARIEDLKGKVVGSNAIGGAMDIGMRAMLRQHAIDPKTDVTIVEAGLANMKAMLSERKLALAPATLPFSYDPELRSIARPLFTQKDAVGTTDMLIWAARTPFLAKNRAAMVDFMEDAVRATHFYIDPANHQEAVDIAAKFTKQPGSNYEGWLFTKNDFYRDPNLLPDLVALQKSIDLQAELAFVKTSFDIKKYTDLSIVEEAASRIK